MNQPGQADTERITELESELRRLRQSDVPEQFDSKKPSSKAKRAVEQNIADLIRSDKSARKSSSKQPREATPSRIAAGSFLDKATCGAGRSSHNPPSSEPSDSPSGSSSDDESSSRNTNGSGDIRRHTSTSLPQTHLSSQSRNKKRMLLKPIPPTKYSGEPDANAFHRFVREGSAYVKMGRVRSRDQVFYLSYYLEGKVRDLYNQIVVRDEDSYRLEKFYLELFEFCFPVDFRSKQRKRLACCIQNKKTVAALVAEFSQIYNTIGLAEGQEKVVKLWNSLCADIRQEMYRKDLDPEISTWDEVVRAAERGEIVRNLDSGSDSSESSVADSKTRKNASKQHTSDRAGGRIALKNQMQVSFAEVPSSESGKEKKRSAKRRNEMLAQGLCFTCEELGHLARNCPTTTNVKSDQRGKPPGFGTHSAQLSSAESALLESTEVLDTLPIGVLNFDYEPVLESSQNAASEDDSKSIKTRTTKPVENADERSAMNGSSARDTSKAGWSSHGSFDSLVLEKIGDRSKKRSGGPKKARGLWTKKWKKTAEKRKATAAEKKREAELAAAEAAAAELAVARGEDLEEDGQESDAEQYSGSESSDEEVLADEEDEDLPVNPNRQNRRKQKRQRRE
ncbi:hypothetical protein B0H12DRAFT_1243344 [Mycena haematopus]|nr:hypothetical protein B0H12DRAFT_1243344 [Mycena haematopus]